MFTIGETAPASKPALRLRDVLGGTVIPFLLFDGAIRLVPWAVVTDTMDRMGYGSSETLVRILGAITIVCSILCGIPPTSILGAILWTGYLGSVAASYLRMDGPLFSQLLFGFYLGLMAVGIVWLRGRNLRTLFAC